MKKHRLPASLMATALLTTPLMAQASMVEGFQNLMDELAKGGNVMWGLLVLSIIALAFTLERLLRLRRDRIVPKGFSEEANALWHKGQYDEVLSLCNQSDSILARTVHTLVDHREAGFADVKMISEDIAASELRLHFRRAQPLAVVGGLAPLIGLLGTVLGMIGAFQNFRLLGETGDPSIFAGDISKAMITTATGLVITVPCLGLFHYFKSRTNSFGDLLEAQLRDLTVEWFVRKKAAPTTREGV
ncbi:MAG: MotA/TolQ/ExbB proton channel family protein [Verrucomicrobia bacterium]|nr:MotA/TolQ/ExbB proton channel family protein [Verrucomicrobiota bacterium]MCH8511478.1 MotA/TolQ/ExbB proton channel family protein [Kiritimatiellia bacterium]